MQLAVVTGGVSGIGKGIAKYFAESGYRVIITGTRDNGEDIANDLGKNVIFKQADVTDEEQVKALFAGLNSLNVLVNAAGIYIGNYDKDLSGVPSSDFEQEWRVNTLGTFLTCKYAAPLLCIGKGNIVNISSISGILSAKDSLGYTTSKAAADMLTKNLALMYVRQGVRVNAVCPGPIDTPMLRKRFDGKLKDNQEYEQWIAHCPMSRCGSVKDIVRGVAYLADPANTYVTGVLLPIDGGYTANAL